MGSKTNEKSKLSNRRGTKPLVEKKRRARINNNLQLIQCLVYDEKQIKNGNRIEKADILEQTVRYLKEVKRKEVEEENKTEKCESVKEEKKEIPVTEDENFLRGYSECATKVDKYLRETECVEAAVRERLQGYLMGAVPSSPPTFSLPAKCEKKEETHQYHAFTPDRRGTLVNIVPGHLENCYLVPKAHSQFYGHWILPELHHYAYPGHPVNPRPYLVPPKHSEMWRPW